MGAKDEYSNLNNNDRKKAYKAVPVESHKDMCWRVDYCSPILIKILITKETIIMKKNDMIRAVASEAEVTNKVVEAVMQAYGKFVLGALNENRDEKVPLPGIGTFSVKHVAERSGIAALAGGKEWTKPAHDELKFTISKSVKTL